MAYRFNPIINDGFDLVGITNTTGLFVNNATDATLTRSGAGPYTLGINLANANTWVGLQTFTTNIHFVYGDSVISVNSGATPKNFSILGSNSTGAGQTGGRVTIISGQGGVGGNSGDISLVTNGNTLNGDINLIAGGNVLLETGSGIFNVFAPTVIEGGYFAVQGGAYTSLDGGAITTDGFGNMTITDGNIFFQGASGNTLLLQQGLITLSQNSAATTTIGASPSGLGVSWNLTLPPTPGGANQFLQTDGTGNTIWADAFSAIVSNDLTGRGAAVTSITTATAPNDGVAHTYSVGGYVTVTAISVNTITLQVTYTDETSAGRTASFFGEGTTTAAIGATGAFPFPPMTIRVKQNTAIVIKTIIVGVGSETYDCGGYIQRIN